MSGGVVATVFGAPPTQLVRAEPCQRPREAIKRGGSVNDAADATAREEMRRASPKSGPCDAEKPDAAVDRPGFGHIASVVDDVAAAHEAVLAADGRSAGEVVTQIKKRVRELALLDLGIDSKLRRAKGRRPAQQQTWRDTCRKTDLSLTHSMSPIPDELAAARAQWQWRGQRRPPFAVVPLTGQVSVWDYPRPPQLASDAREVVVRWGGVELARTRRAVRVLETAHPPSFYLPWNDVARQYLQPASGSSFCEWKGQARYWSLVDGNRHLPRVAWSYPQPLAGAEALADCVAFYAADLECSVDGAPVTPQPGHFYGGWITPELTGPFKGEVGSEAW